MNNMTDRKYKKRSERITNLLAKEQFEELLLLSKTKKFKSFFNPGEDTFEKEFQYNSKTIGFIKFLIKQDEIELVFAITSGLYRLKTHILPSIITLIIEKDSSDVWIDDIFSNLSICRKLTAKFYFTATKKYDIEPSYLKETMIGASELGMGDVALVDRYYREKFEVESKEFPLDILRRIYNQTKDNRYIVSAFIDVNTIAAFLEDNTVHINYSEFLLTFVTNENAFKMLKNFFSDDVSFKEVLDIITVLDTGKTEIFNLILDALNCKDSDVIVEMLDKSTLDQHRKEEILLLKAKSNCKY